MTEWIKCSDRLPEIDGKYGMASKNILVFVPSSLWGIYLCSYFPGIGWNLIPGLRYLQDKPTHWMPLPKEPHELD